jgi:hypothetical protein
MTDLDSIADLDPLTGLPVVDHRAKAERWLDALDNSPVSTPSPVALPYNNFGQVGAGETTNETAAPTAAKKGKYKMYYVNNSNNNPIPSDLEEADCAETFGSVFQHLWSEGGEVHAQMGSVPLTLTLNIDKTTVSVCCGNEIIQPVALITRSSLEFKPGTASEDELRVVNMLNAKSTGPRYHRCQESGSQPFIMAEWNVPAKAGFTPMALAEAVSLFAVGVCVALEQIDPTEASDDTNYREEEKQ